MITLLKIFPEKWEQAKGYLRLDLEALEAAMNQRWSVTFGANNLLNPDTIQGWDTTQTLYVSNEATTPEAGWPMWAQVNLANGVKNRLPFSNFVAATAGSKLVGRRSGSAGDFEEISLGAGLVMVGTTLQASLAGLVPIPDEPYRDDPWPTGTNVGMPISTALTPGSIVFIGPSGNLAQDNSNLFWDDANNRLGIGFNAPTNIVDVRSTSPIVGVYHSDTAGFAALRFFEGTTLRSSVQHIGTTFATSGRRDDLELVTLQSTGDVVLRPNDTEAMRVTPDSLVMLGATTAPSAGTQGIIFGDGTALSTMASNTAGIYANDVSGTVKMFAITEGNVTGEIAMNTAAVISGGVVFGGTTGLLNQSTAASDFYWDNTNKRVGLGTSSPGGQLDMSSTSSTDQAFGFRATAIHNTATAGTVYGAQFNVRCSHTSGTMNASQAFFIQAYYQGTGTGITGQTAVIARGAIAGTSPTGTISTNNGVYIDQISNQATGTPAVTITTARGLLVINQGTGTGVNGLTITTALGVAIGEQAAGTNQNNLVIGQTGAVSGSWSIYNVSAYNNYFASPLYMGHTSTWGSGSNFISFADGTVPGTPPSNTAALYANDVGGTVELFAIDEASVVSQLTGLDIRKTADESVANNTPQDDNHLTTNLLASTSYRFKFYLFATSPATAGLLLQLDGTAGVSSLKANINIYDSTGALVKFGRITAFNSSVGVDFTGDAYATIEGVIEVSTAGTFRLEWAQNTTDGGNATVLQEDSALNLRLLNA